MLEETQRLHERPEREAAAYAAEAACDDALTSKFSSSPPSISPRADSGS